MAVSRRRKFRRLISAIHCDEDAEHHQGRALDNR